MSVDEAAMDDLVQAVTKRKKRFSLDFNAGAQGGKRVLISSSAVPSRESAMRLLILAAPEHPQKNSRMPRASLALFHTAYAHDTTVLVFVSFSSIFSLPLPLSPLFRLSCSLEPTWARQGKPSGVLSDDKECQETLASMTER